YNEECLKNVLKIIEGRTGCRLFEKEGHIGLRILDLKEVLNLTKEYEKSPYFKGTPEKMLEENLALYEERLQLKREAELPNLEKAIKSKLENLDDKGIINTEEKEAVLDDFLRNIKQKKLSLPKENYGYEMYLNNLG